MLYCWPLRNIYILSLDDTYQMSDEIAKVTLLDLPRKLNGAMLASSQKTCNLTLTTSSFEKLLVMHSLYDR